MARISRDRRPNGILSIALAALIGIAVTAPLAAQGPSSRFRVLLPRLEPQGDVDDGFGEDVVEHLRGYIDDLATHSPVGEDAFDNALDQYDLDDDELTCIQSRQVAIQIQAQLVMCGSYARASGEAVSVTAEFISVQSGESFQIPTFTASSPEDAAQNIFTQFEDYVQQLRFTTFCIQYLNSRQYESAIRNCNDALAISPNSVRALYAKARATMNLADPAPGADSATAEGASWDTALLEQSLGIHQRVLELNPIHQDALKSAGIVAAHLERDSLARDYFGQFLEMNPNASQVRLTIAIDLAQAGDPMGALQIVEDGMQGDSVDLSLYEYAGHFALSVAQEMKSSESQDNGEELSPQTTAMFEKALGYYQRVFESQGPEADAVMLGNMLASLRTLGRVDDAIALGSDIVATKSESAGLWSAYADVLREAGQFDEALAALDSVAALDPDYERLYAKRGLWLVQAGRIEEAVPVLEEAVTRGGARSDVMAQQIFNYGYTQRFQNDEYQAAVDVYEVAQQFATEPATVGMLNFFTGYALTQYGRVLQAPSTAESAELALPIFQRALENIRQSTAYAKTNPQIASQRTQLMANLEQLINIQELLIEQN